VWIAIDISCKSLLGDRLAAETFTQVGQKLESP
jgi:hypothetical protein